MDDNNYNVGIGTTTPSMMLDINGDANLTGTAYIGNSTLYVGSNVVGIGTITPTHTLSAQGTMNITRAAGAAGGIEVDSTGNVIIRLG